LVAHFVEESRLRVFESGVQRRIFVHKRDDVEREWRKVRNEELNDLYFKPNIIWLMISRLMMWTVHVARIRGFWWGNLRKRSRFETQA